MPKSAAAFNASNTTDAVTGLGPWGYMVSTPVEFSAEGTQAIVVSAFAADGSTSTVTRTLIFNQTPPQIVGTITPNGSNFEVTVTNGTTRVCVADCQGANDLTGIGVTAADGSTRYTVDSTQLATLTFFDAAGSPTTTSSGTSSAHFIFSSGSRLVGRFGFGGVQLAPFDAALDPGEPDRHVTPPPRGREALRSPASRASSPARRGRAWSTGG